MVLRRERAKQGYREDTSDAGSMTDESLLSDLIAFHVAASERVNSKLLADASSLTEESLLDEILTTRVSQAL